MSTETNSAVPVREDASRATVDRIDHPTNRWLYARMLEQLGFDPKQSHDPSDVLAALARLSAQAGEIAGLREDKARLDAMERAGWHVTPDTGSRWTVWISVPTGGGDCDEVELTRTNRPATLREALDIAAGSPRPHD